MSIATAEAAPRSHLLHILGVGFSVAVALGSMIGSGVLRTPASVAAGVQSASVILALWILGAVHAALGANILVELGTSVPRNGGPYVFTHRALGDVPGLIVGWSTWGATVAGVAAAAVSFANFFAILVPSMANHQAGIAVALQLILYGTNIMGLREGRVLQEASSFAKAALLLAFAIAAAFAIPARASAFLPSPAAAMTWVGIVGAYQLIRGAYAGWDAPIYFSEENERPAMSLPRGVFIGLALTSFLYIAVNAGLLHALGPRAMATSTLPFMQVLRTVAGPFASVLFAVGAMTTVLSCANANIMIAPRVLFALARDRLLPSRLAAVNAGGSPHFAYWITGIASVALAATGQFALVFGLIGTLDTLSGILTAASFFVLRAREPGLPRPYRAFAYPILPLAAISIDIVLLVLFNAANWRGFAAAVAISALCVPFAWIAHRARRMDDAKGNGTA
jgi:APA family basic amino acid/polyamine antiporter